MTGSALCRPDYEHELMAAFGTLQDEYYPGSKRKRRESLEMRQERVKAEKAQAREEESWDAHPLKKWVKGVERQQHPPRLDTEGLATTQHLSDRPGRWVQG